MHFPSFGPTSSISILYSTGTYAFWIYENQSINIFLYGILFHIFTKSSISAISFL